MTDFKKDNLDEMEGFERGAVSGVFSRSHLGAEQIGLSRFRYGADARAAFGHRHGIQEEIYLVTNGSGRMKLDDEVVELKQWDIIRVAPTVTRAFEGGPDGLEVVIAGGNRPEEGDGEMVEDFWPEGD